LSEGVCFFGVEVFFMLVNPIDPFLRLGNSRPRVAGIYIKMNLPINRVLWFSGLRL